MSACPNCSNDNPPDAGSCQACGALLGAAATDPGLDEWINAGVVCPKCDAYNDPGQRQCIACGQALAGLTGYLQAVGDPGGTQPQLPAAVPPPQASEPSAAPVRTSTAQLHAAPDPSAAGPAPAVCPHCRAILTVGANVCLACGQRTTSQAPANETAADLSIRLRLVRGYGREDSTFPVGLAGVTIGRSQALVNIPDDPFLAPCHLALQLDGGRLLAEDQGGLNGTFLRVRGQIDVKQGAEFISGNQRFSLLGLGGPTTDVRMPSSQDTRPYGGPVPRQLFVALRLHHANADGRPRAGSVILRSGPVISVGQRGCDLNFPTDPAMSPHQFELHLRPSGTLLVETGASTGVFLRLTSKTAIVNGDELLVGDEVFRVEIG